MEQTAVRRTIEAVWRIESARIVAGLARVFRDVGLAEDAAQDALVAALTRWPETGIPDNPGAWLTAAARHRAVDLLRRDALLDRKREELGRESATRGDPSAAAFAHALEAVDDDLLRLIFTTCHPVLSRQARVALTLRLLGGLSTGEIARAFLVPEPTVAQRIVRAKRALAAARVPLVAPQGAELAARLPSVLEVIYFIFNEGYAVTEGDRWIRKDLCDEAARLGRMLAELLPREPEVHGLVALIEIQASRLPARVAADGESVLLADQNRALWDQLLIHRGLAALQRAARLDGLVGPYVLQAEIAACHARTRTPAETDWARIVALYGALAQVAPSPVVELNRAVALAMAYGPEPGLIVVEALRSEPSLQRYHLLPAVRGDLLAKLGRLAEARAEFERAAALASNRRERALLRRRAGACGSSG